MDPNFDRQSKRDSALMRGVDLARADFARGDRIRAHFPDLYVRLEKAIAATGADANNGRLASRHILSAEALVEVLERRAADGRANQGDEQGAIVSEYSELVLRKLVELPQRPAVELQRIAEIFPEVDLDLVRRCYVQKLASGELAAAALEDSIEYTALLKSLPTP